MFTQGIVVILKALWDAYRNRALMTLMLGLALSGSGCGTRATASDMHVERIYGPDGSTCYVIVQEGRAVGGNCVANSQ